MHGGAEHCEEPWRGEREKEKATSASGGDPWRWQARGHQGEEIARGSAQGRRVAGRREPAHQATFAVARAVAWERKAATSG